MALKKRSTENVKYSLKSDTDNPSIFQIKPLKVRDYNHVLDYVRADDTNMILDICISKGLINWTNFIDEKNKKIKFTTDLDILDDLFFAEDLNEIADKIIEISRPSKAEVKN